MPGERWQRVFADYSTSSFTELLRLSAPHLLPGHREPGTPAEPLPAVPHGTTVLALRVRDPVHLHLAVAADGAVAVAHRALPSRSWTGHQQSSRRNGAL